MGLVRLLFLRALCAWWWRTPYRGALRRWGTGLHDRFLLEHHAWADVADVCAQLAEAGYPFPAAWLRPEVDHRFPVLGRVEDGGVELEVRGALEPWNVLGEDVEAGGTARRVDWSTERIQVRLRTEPGRVCALLCNGFAVPLRTTGTPGVSVAGLRFRARRLERSLHPTLPAQSPLELDVVSGGRVVAACSYAAWEPGDQAWPAPPLTAAEAKARRADRFSVRPAGGEAPDVAAVSGDEDGPWTFDLRAAAASAGPSVTLDLRNRPAPAREVR